MSKPRDYYEILGIERGATTDQIRKAYRKLARQLHPDVNKAPDAAKRFSEVQEAYDVLSEPEKRKAYDRFGHAGVGSAAGGGASPHWEAQAHGARRENWSSGQGVEFDAGDFSDIFEQMFGGRTGGTRRAGRSARESRQPSRGQDTEHTITVTFLTAAMGGSEHIRIGADGASTITVKIPPGINHGARLRVKGKGGSVPGGAPGDLLLTVEVGQHPYFRREGLDLLIEVPLSITEAVFGTTVNVPLLKGGAVEVRIPAGMASGQRLRVRGKGVTNAKGATGDYYVVAQIVAPAANTLDVEDRAALEIVSRHLPNPRKSAPWVDD